MMTLSPSNRSLLTGPVLLMWLALAGLLLAGGIHAHAQVSSGSHQHNSVSNPAADDHAHLEGGNLVPDLGAALIVHCGADILADIGGTRVQTVWLSVSILTFDDDNSAAASFGFDPPPPRLTS